MVEAAPVKAIAVAPLAIMMFFAFGLVVASIGWWGRSRRVIQAEYPPMVRPVGCGQRRRSVWGLMAALIGLAAVMHLYAVRSERQRPATVATATVYKPEVGGRTVMTKTEVRQEPPPPPQ